MAERYRELQGQSLLETGVVQDNAGSVASTLAQTFKAFEQQATNKAQLLAEERGTREGTAAGAAGTPGVRKGLRAGTAYGRAYNNAALRSYAIKAEADADETAARLEVEAGTDPDKFRATFGRVQDEMMKTAQPEVHGLLNETFSRRMSAGLQRIEFARAREVRDEQRATTSEGIGRAIDKVGQLRSTDDPADFAMADEEEVKLQLLIDGAVADGTLSRVEGEALHLEAARGIVKKTVVARFAREFDSPYGNPVGFIERLREANKTAEALPPEEEAKLQDALLAELRERNALRNAKEAGLADAIRLRHIEGDRQATAELLRGTLTQGKLLKLVEDNRIDAADARTLLNELQTGSTAKSDPVELFSVETNLLGWEETDIATNSQLSFADRSRLIQKRREEANGWKGTQQAREGAERIDRALGLVPGMNTKLLSPEEARKRDTALTEWYQLVDGLPAEERQFKAIELAEQVTTRVIKQTANVSAEKVRGRIERLKTQYGDPSKLSESERKAFESELARQQQRLDKLEQQAK